MWVYVFLSKDFVSLNMLKSTHVLPHAHDQTSFSVAWEEKNWGKPPMFILLSYFLFFPLDMFLGID